MSKRIVESLWDCPYCKLKGIGGLTNKYYYDIDKWVMDRTESSKGADNAPYWSAYTLAENERTEFQGGAYVLLIKTKESSYFVSVPLAIWEKYHAGDQVTISVINGNIVSINDESVR